MTREEIYQRCEREIDRTKGVLLEAGTGYGKTSVAINLLNHINSVSGHPVNVLYLVDRNVQKKTAMVEFSKWRLDCNINVQLECYASLKNHVGKTYDVVVLDECHHVRSELKRELLSHVTFEYMIGLSATIPYKLRQYFVSVYHVGFVSRSLNDAIEDGVLPEPEIMLLPLQLDNTIKCEEIEVNPKGSRGTIYDDYEKLWYYKKNKLHAVLRCTRKQKLQYLDNKIIFAKRAFDRTRNEGAKLRWLRMCGDRLKFLAECKNDLVRELLDKISDKRVLTFCTSIEQTEKLGCNCIHSKNKDANVVLDKFNEGKLNHITACQVLNEGVNLKNCQFGIFANINASGIIKVQRVGRILRHEHPIVIIPYYVGSREEEIVKDWIGEYDERLIHEYNTLNDLINAIIN